MTQTTTSTNEAQLTTLQALRTMHSTTTLTTAEAFAVAEKQALRFLNLEDCREPKDITDRIEAFPWIDIAFVPDLPVSGATELIGKRWHIAINGDDAPTRQRFTLAHEFGHIVGHGHHDTNLRGDRRLMEAVCDHFAGCLLIPRPWLKREWTSGRQDVDDLASYFGVSRQAMIVRLNATGLRDIPRRDWQTDRLRRAFHARRRPTGGSRRYFRTDPAQLMLHADTRRGTTAGRV